MSENSEGKISGPNRDQFADEEETIQRKVVDYWEEGVLRNRIAETTNVVLPNVKELTRKFAKGIDEFTPKPSPTQSATNQEFAEIKKSRAVDGRDSPATTDSDVEKEGERKVPPSETSRIEPSSDGQIERKESPSPVKRIESKGGKPKSNESIKMNSSSGKSSGKEVHSLTARSISKEFREELRNNANRRPIQRVDRGCSGENNQVVSESGRSKSPTPLIDMKSKRKFWEDIISNAGK